MADLQKTPRNDYTNEGKLPARTYGNEDHYNPSGYSDYAGMQSKNSQGYQTEEPSTENLRHAKLPNIKEQRERERQEAKEQKELERQRAKDMALSQEHRNELHEKTDYIEKYIEASKDYVDTGRFRLAKTKYDTGERRWPGQKRMEDQNPVERGAGVIFGGVGKVLGVTLGTTANVVFGGLNTIAENVNSALGEDAVQITSGASYSNDGRHSNDVRHGEMGRSSRYRDRDHHDRGHNHGKEYHGKVVHAYYSVGSSGDYDHHRSSRRQNDELVARRAVNNRFLPKLQKDYETALYELNNGFESGDPKRIEKGEKLLNRLHDSIVDMKSKLRIVTNDYDPWLNREF